MNCRMGTLALEETVDPLDPVLDYKVYHLRRGGKVRTKPMLIGKLAEAAGVNVQTVR
ncbi:MAG: hypothetical protein HY650_05400 [Acidobacteria bacterium]|nr:hypothetical protein [Acidobacteriota bacterium]